jgi:hypothetical protein
MIDDSQPPKKPAGNSDFDLSKFDTQFARAPVYDGDDVPTGRYHVRVKDAVLVEVHENEFIFRWELTVVAGPFTGWDFCKGMMIVEKTLHIIKWDLLAVGLKLDNISDLPRHLPSLRGRELEVAIRNQGPIRDIHFINGAQKEFERARRI